MPASFNTSIKYKFVFTKKTYGNTQHTQTNLKKNCSHKYQFKLRIPQTTISIYCIYQNKSEFKIFINCKILNLSLVH